MCHADNEKEEKEKNEKNRTAKSGKHRVTSRKRKWQIFANIESRRLSNSGTYMELRTTSFIESTGVACSDSVSHNRVQVLSIPVLLLACSQEWTSNLQMIVSLEA